MQVIPFANAVTCDRCPIGHLARNGYLDLVIESLPMTTGRSYFDTGFVRERTTWIVKLEEVTVLDVALKDVYGSGTALDNSRGIMTVPPAGKPNPKMAVQRPRQRSSSVGTIRAMSLCDAINCQLPCVLAEERTHTGYRVQQTP